MKVASLVEATITSHGPIQYARELMLGPLLQGGVFFAKPALRELNNYEALDQRDRAVRKV